MPDETGRANTSSTGAFFTIASATTRPRATLDSLDEAERRARRRRAACPSPTVKRTLHCESALAFELEEAELVGAELDGVGLDRRRDGAPAS